MRSAAAQRTFVQVLVPQPVDASTNRMWQPSRTCTVTVPRWRTANPGRSRKVPVTMSPVIVPLKSCAQVFPSWERPTHRTVVPVCVIS